MWNRIMKTIKESCFQNTATSVGLVWLVYSYYWRHTKRLERIIAFISVKEPCTSQAIQGMLYMESICMAEWKIAWNSDQMNRFIHVLMRFINNPPTKVISAGVYTYFCHQGAQWDHIGWVSFGLLQEAQGNRKSDGLQLVRYGTAR